MRNIPDKITIKDSSIKRRGEKKKKNEITVKVSNIGLLRQFINELPEGEMVTDEDIIKFLI